MQPFLTRHSFGIASAAALWLAGCGAPTKGANEVGAAFKGSQDLKGKMVKLCAELGSPQGVKDMGKLLPDAAACASAGSQAQNAAQMRSFQFSEWQSESVSEGGEKIQRVRLRAQVWLNQDLANLVGSLSKALRLDEATASPTPSPAATPAAGQAREILGGLARVILTEKVPMKYLQGNTTFSGDIRFKMEGLVNLENDLAVRGQVRDNAFVFNMRCQGDAAPFERTLLRKIDGTVFLVPYASDIYLDATFSFDMYSLGLDSMARAVLEFGLGTALNSLTKVLKSS